MVIYIYTYLYICTHRYMSVTAGTTLKAALLGASGLLCFLSAASCAQRLRRHRASFGTPLPAAKAQARFPRRASVQLRVGSLPRFLGFSTPGSGFCNHVKLSTTKRVKAQTYAYLARRTLCFIGFPYFAKMKLEASFQNRSSNVFVSTFGSLAYLSQRLNMVLR